MPKPLRNKALPAACGGVLAFLALHLVIPVAFGATSCATHQPAKPTPVALNVWRDPATGCHWLYVAGGTPTMRRDEDGVPYCTDLGGRRIKDAGRLGVASGVREPVRKGD